MRRNATDEASTNAPYAISAYYGLLGLKENSPGNLRSGLISYSLGTMGSAEAVGDEVR